LASTSCSDRRFCRRITRSRSPTFRLYGDERYLSHTVTNVENTRNISVGDLNKELGKRGAMISNGYGDLKDKCFRIAHMGDLNMADMRWLTAQIDDILGL
jgi:aspartate aminotransferase-like enzyme